MQAQLNRSSRIERNEILEIRRPLSVCEPDG